MQRNGPWILIVEEDPRLAKVLTLGLGNEGFRVVHCSRPSQAATMLVNQRFACILLDLDMSRSAGEAVISLVHDDEKGFNRTSPIITIRDGYDLETLRRIGPHVAAALLKPVNRADLFERLRQLCPLPTDTMFPGPLGFFRFG
jgi:DNA-binding response OmpR family regulator